MLAWWRQRSEHEQISWCNVVHDHGPITPEMAEVVGSYGSGGTSSEAWLIAIRDSSAPMTGSEQTWIMSQRFEAFIREQCR